MATQPKTWRKKRQILTNIATQMENMTKEDLADTSLINLVKSIRSSCNTILQATGIIVILE